MSFFPYAFEAQVETHDVGSGRYRYKVLFLPDDLESVLPFEQYPRLRIVGEINDFPYEGSCTPVRGRHYLLLSNTYLEKIDADVGSHVEVRFAIADQDAVDVPQALTEALQENPDMRDLWDDLTPGKQRGLAYMVSTAKTKATAQKRIAVVFDIMTGKRDQRGKLIAS